MVASGGLMPSLVPASDTSCGPASESESECASSPTTVSDTTRPIARLTLRVKADGGARATRDVVESTRTAVGAVPGRTLPPGPRMPTRMTTRLCTRSRRSGSRLGKSVMQRPRIGCSLESSWHRDSTSCVLRRPTRVVRTSGTRSSDFFSCSCVTLCAACTYSIGTPCALLTSSRSSLLMGGAPPAAPARGPPRPLSVVNMELMRRR
mmetsp:Transcript_7964/g.28402  ORF Transcript_7964/g.28402 Transcript_7964/m.28402 type:complete len:207 (+) Transcript_7964:394-1014(+)